MRSVIITVALTAIFIFLSTSNAVAIDRVVNTTGEFSTAITAAQPGDFISLQPGTYVGGHFRAGLTDVTIRLQPGATGEAILSGGTNGIQLSDATNVTIEGLTFVGQTGNGLNIDDGGSFATPSTNIMLRNITVRDMASGGNSDAIKLSGVTGFLIDQVTIFNWGGDGSAIDPVGSHHGVIQNSHFRHTSNSGGSAVRPKGGSKDIIIRGNLIEMPNGNGRAIQAGGSTDTQFFRFIDGDSDYEAAEITAYGNRIVGGSSAFSWINIDGGHFHHNDLRQPGTWAMRILNENPGSAIIDTRNGMFTDNTIEFNDSSWSRAVNIGDETEPTTFSFARNRWLNTDDPTPAGSTPSTLPTPEVAGQYGVAAPFTDDEPMRWDFSWGEWIVPVDADGAVLPVTDTANLLIATPGDDATFSPLDADPLTGNWTFVPATASVTTSTFDPIVLIDAGACALCQTMPGDYDRSGTIDTDDLALWQSQFGTVGAALADGNGNGVVDAADYTVWRDASAASTATVPEPATLGLLLVTLIGNITKR